MSGQKLLLRRHRSLVKRDAIELTIDHLLHDIRSGVVVVRCIQHLFLWRYWASWLCLHVCRNVFALLLATLFSLFAIVYVTRVLLRSWRLQVFYSHIWLFFLAILLRCSCLRIAVLRSRSAGSRCGRLTLFEVGFLLDTLRHYLRAAQWLRLSVPRTDKCTVFLSLNLIAVPDILLRRQNSSPQGGHWCGN